MATNTVWKGRRMEDLVEEMLKLRGFRFERNVRVRGRSGTVHEVDFIVYTAGGLVLYEVKNLDKPVPKEVVIKAYEVARDIGASKAVVVSPAGFTDSAVKVARTLGVELIDLEGLLGVVEASRLHGGAVFLEGKLDADEARRFAGRMLRRRVFFKAERIADLKCAYAPFYFFEGDFKVGESTFRLMTFVASGLTGLPLEVSGGALAEAARRAALLPADLLPLYSEVAGKTVKSSEAAILYGEARWKRLLSTLESVGLAERVSRRPLIVKVLDDRPGVERLERAASLFISRASHLPSSECAVIEPRLSPGASRALLSGLYAFNATRETLVYAPIYIFIVEDLRRPVYRLLYLTAWLKKPLVYKPAVDIRL